MFLSDSVTSLCLVFFMRVFYSLFCVFFRRLLEAFCPWLFGDDIIESVQPIMYYSVIDVVKINK